MVDYTLDLIKYNKNPATDKVLILFVLLYAILNLHISSEKPRDMDMHSMYCMKWPTA